MVQVHEYFSRFKVSISSIKLRSILLVSSNSLTLIGLVRPPKALQCLWASFIPELDRPKGFLLPRGGSLPSHPEQRVGNRLSLNNLRFLSYPTFERCLLPFLEQCKRKRVVFLLFLSLSHSLPFAPLDHSSPRSFSVRSIWNNTLESGEWGRIPCSTQLSIHDIGKRGSSKEASVLIKRSNFIHSSLVNIVPNNIPRSDLETRLAFRVVFSTIFFSFSSSRYIHFTSSFSTRVSDVFWKQKEDLHFFIPSFLIFSSTIWKFLVRMIAQCSARKVGNSTSRQILLNGKRWSFHWQLISRSSTVINTCFGANTDTSMQFQ